MWAMVRSFGSADPVDAPVGLLLGFAQFAVGGLLVRGDHSPSHVPLVADPPGGVHSLDPFPRSIPSSSPEASRAATSCTDPG